MNPQLYLVFDVESIGLHGEGFSVGWVVINEDGSRIERQQRSCHPSLAAGGDDGRQWVAENVPIPSMGYNCVSPKTVREQFWKEWIYWKKKGALLVVDCGWPVEARFLAQCVDDDPEKRKWEGPYPLHDLASVLLAAGADPLGSKERVGSLESLEHDSLSDATQSARLLCEAIHILDGEIVAHG